MRHPSRTRAGPREGAFNRLLTVSNRSDDLPVILLAGGDVLLDHTGPAERETLSNRGGNVAGMWQRVANRRPQGGLSRIPKHRPARGAMSDVGRRMQRAYRRLLSESIFSQFSNSLCRDRATGSRFPSDSDT